MFIQHSVHISRPTEECVSALAKGPRSWFPDLRDDKSAKVGLSIAGIGVHKRVSVELGEMRKDGGWAELPVTWKATFAKSLFPVFNGKVQLSPVDPGVTRLTVSGMYKPPLGELGMELDDAVMSRVAKATVKELAESIAAQLEKAG